MTPLERWLCAGIFAIFFLLLTDWLDKRDRVVEVDCDRPLNVGEARTELSRSDGVTKVRCKQDD